MKYYYIVMSQFDLLKNQVIEEIIRERSNYFINRKDCLNFWLIMSPKFINEKNIKNKILTTNFYKQKSTELEYNDELYTAAFITTDYEYISWLKLRLGYFENVVENEMLPNSNIHSDGIYGFIEINSLNNQSVFESIKFNINPKLLIEKYKKSLDIYLKI